MQRSFCLFLVASAAVAWGTTLAADAPGSDCAQPFFPKRITGERSLNNKAWGYGYARDLVLAGERSQRFEVRAGDCAEDPGWSDCKNDRERSEISVSSPKLFPGDKKFIAWNIYLPDDFQTSTQVNTTLGQIHQRGGPGGTAGGLPSFPPLLQFEALGESYNVCWHKLSGDARNVKDICVTHELARVADMRGKWTEIVMAVDLSMQTGGATIYVNGQAKATYRDPLLVFEPKELYLKYGIYRSFVSKHGGPMPTQVAYYDEVRIADKLSHASRFVCDLKPVD